jgi:hypothetical protein
VLSSRRIRRSTVGGRTPRGGGGRTAASHDRQLKTEKKLRKRPQRGQEKGQRRGERERQQCRSDVEEERRVKENGVRSSL